jgi:hypothetical protein
MLRLYRNTVVGIIVLAAVSSPKCPGQTGLTASNLNSEGEKLIATIVSEIKTSPEGIQLLENVDLSHLSFRHQLYDLGASGGIVEWDFGRNVTLVSNSNVESPHPYMIAFTDNKGIALRVFVTSGEGDNLVSMDHRYTISKNPRIVLGYFLSMAADDKAIISRIEQLMKAAIISLPHPPENDAKH